jgi:hypothetical protein
MLSIAPMFGRQRLGKNPLIVARQRLGKNLYIVARQRLGRNVTAVKKLSTFVDQRFVLILFSEVRLEI